jgi:hypothetical protein
MPNTARSYDIQHNDTQDNDIQNNGAQHEGPGLFATLSKNNTQHNNILYQVPIC